MLLLFENARAYNAAGSQVYNDAVALEKAFQTQPKSGKHPPAAIGGATAAGSKRLRNGEHEDQPARKVTASDPSKPKSVMMLDAWTAVRNTKDENGRERATNFIQLPPAEELPDYYKVISSPIDMRMVREKIDEGQYRRWDSFERDMLLVFANARLFNLEDSQIYEDAVALEKVFKSQPKPIEGVTQVFDPSVERRKPQSAQDFGQFSKRKSTGANESDSNMAGSKRRR